jgi:hypothetical protein
MVKWVVEEDVPGYFDGTKNTAYDKLRKYRQNPSPANLEFFNIITDATSAPATSGWVSLSPITGRPADRRNNFKFNTNHVNFNNKDLWVYVIAQDTVQNLGFVMQKIRVDQSSDTPKLNVEAFSDVNANEAAPVTFTESNYNTALNVIVNDDRTLGGNINLSRGFRNNVLEENQGVDLNFTDFDGINLGAGDDSLRGVSITVYDLNGLKNGAGAGLSGTLTGAEIRQALRDGNKNNRSGMLSQQVMAAVLYRNLSPAPAPLPQHLYDGIYKIEITYSDDVNEKVAITLADRPGMNALQPGDTPVSAAGAPNPKVYFFAVNAETEKPEITVDSVAENQMQSAELVTVFGTVRSRLKVQKLWATFAPDITSVPPGTYNSSSTPELLTLYTSNTYATAITDWLGHEGKDAEGYYIYYWKRDNVSFQPYGNNYTADQDERRLILEAYDRLGNRNSFTRTVLVDNDPPDVSVTFNYDRPPDGTGVFIVNGKVPFTVTATDNNRLDESASDRPADPYSGVKWWVFPVSNPADAEWGTAFASLPTGTGGRFYRSQEANGGRFTAVINTTFLTDLTEYKLYVAARDSAGNTRIVLAVERFFVDQSSDFPVLNVENLNPPPGAVRGGLSLSIGGGTVSDDDGFDRNKLTVTPAPGGSGYVRIRFPATWNAVTGEPLTWNDSSWISVPGTVNPEGAVRFNFKFEDLPDGTGNAVFNGYLGFDGPKHYQIMVTDEAVAGANDRPPGKNPDGELPGGPTYIGPASKTYPSDTGSYSFILDTKPPEIFFDNYDPTEGHPNYNPRRPTYAKFAAMTEELKGSVRENNLESLTVVWENFREEIKDGNSDFTIINGVRDYPWNITDISPEMTEKFEKRFNEAGEGLQSIILEAVDTANNVTRVVWIFTKDTQGPDIIVNSIRRSIRHAPVPPAFAPPNTGVFPGNWPLDWPSHDGGWKGDAGWASIRNNYGANDWPSEYAFYTGETAAAKVTKVRQNLIDDNAREVSVISGNTGDIFIRGGFSDSLSDIWNNPGDLPPFYYRFHENGVGDGRDINVPVSNTAGWIPGVIQTPTADQINRKRYNSADWVIPLSEPYFTFADGEHTFDIKMRDKAGNWSDIYGLRFIVDRSDPVLLGYTANGSVAEPVPAPPARPDVPNSFKVESGGVARPLPEQAERVFSAANAPANGTNNIFTLSGFVRDNNLSELFAVISSDGLNPYSVTANVAVGAWVDGGPAFNSVDTLSGGTYVTPVTDTVVPRLTVTPTATPHEWAWTLKLLEKDAYALLRGTDGDGTRRYVNVTAVDKAKRRAGPERWFFYLDSVKPAIEYTNLEKGTDYTVNGNGVNDITLQGIASDDTKIRDIKYSIAKWDYTAKGWRWYSATDADWVAARPAADTWPSLLDTGYTAANAQSMVNWTLNNEKLNASGLYPQNLFQTEAMYKIDLLVTDWSIAYTPNVDGNPHNTSFVNDDEYKDGGVLIETGQPNSYNPAIPGAGNASARKFFIDRSDPVVVPESEDILYYKNGADDKLSFGLTASDPNTVASVTARVRKPDGEYFNVAQNLITVTHIAGTEWGYTVTVTPVMTETRTAGGTKLPFGNYLLEITVRDGAGRETVESRPFTLDNEPPKPAVVSPPGGDEAVTGQVTIRGNTTENSNQIKRTAFYLAKAPGYGEPPAAYTGDISTDHANGWCFYVDYLDYHRIKYDHSGGGVLIQIDSGTFTWEIRIPNTRNFFIEDGRNYARWMKAGDPGTEDLTYDGRPIPAGEDVGKIVLYIVAEDEAGNVTMEPKTFWLYPEGDRPVITRITNPDDKKAEAERLMNGRIRIAGMATDNERVHRVWFRVLRTNADGSIGAPYTEADKLSIYSWNTETWEAAAERELDGSDRFIDNRTSRTLYDEAGKNLGTGWYGACLSGSSANVSWWAYINMEGELEPTGSGPNKITVEVRAEDTTRNDLDEWITNGRGMVSRDKTFPQPPYIPPTDSSIGNTVTAFVIRGAPIFENEMVRTADPLTGEWGAWGGIVENNISKRAQYQITVKDDSGIGSLRWIPEGEIPINLLDPNLLYNKNIYQRHLTAMGNGVLPLPGYAAGKYDNPGFPDTPPADAGNPGIAVKAEPKKEYIVTGSLDGSHTGKTFLILESDPALAFDNETNPTRGWVPATENVPFTTFTVGTVTGSIGNAKLLRQTEASAPNVTPVVKGGYFEWVVIVDVETRTLNNGRHAFAQGNPDSSFMFPVELSASEISKTSPLTTSRTAYLPIDNMPPKGTYTINTRPAGQAAAIGGEAGDDGPVNGIAKVVVWFSRKQDGVENYVSWHEKGVNKIHGDEASGWKDGLGPIAFGDWEDGEEVEVLKPRGTAPEKMTLPYIPPEGDATGGHYAIVIDRNDPSGVKGHHGHKIPMGLTPGGLGKIWYIELNSFALVSGPVYIHYVVFDTAGNASYFKERLIVMNHAPQIARVKFGTDIRKNDSLQSVIAGGTGNYSLATGLAANTGNIPMNFIRSLVPLGTNDVEKGITEYVSLIRTSETGAVRVIDDFRVRNFFMAFRAETAATPDPKKYRSFRFEYVSGTKKLEKTGGNSGGSLTQIKEGRMYIIDEPGNVRWGAVGGPNVADFRRGMAFMASLNGTDEEGYARAGFDGPDTYGSVWELNSNYYDAQGERTNVPGNLSLGTPRYEIGQDTSATEAEFVYKRAAFSTSDGDRGTRITDFDPNLNPNNPGVDPSLPNSLFILKVFDGPEEDLFADYAVFSIRVNNNDKTKPYARIYDLNPKMEGREQPQTAQRSIVPLGIGQNRTRGGIYNTDETGRTINKSGHVEPRKLNNLTSVEMGGSEELRTVYPGGYNVSVVRGGNGQPPSANRLSMYDTDTVSGSVILRGYAEDDQRISRVDLIFTDVTGNVSAYNARILDGDQSSGRAADTLRYIPPATGLLLSKEAYFTDTIDLYRHRVEWAYVWDTETVPNGLVVGTVTVRAVAYNENTAAAQTDPAAGTASFNKVSANTAAPTGGALPPREVGYAGPANDYNSIRVEVMPFVAGFHRDRSKGYHNTRSSQGWYSFARSGAAVALAGMEGERVVMEGFNLKKNNQETRILFTGSYAIITDAVTATERDNFGLPSLSTVRYQAFSVPTDARSGPIEVYSFRAPSRFFAANSGKTKLNDINANSVDSNGGYWVQPWNMEWSPGTEGSEMWNDILHAHIWQSDDHRPTASVQGGYYTYQGAFPTRKPNYMVEFPAMAVDPSNGRLYASHSEGGAGLATENPYQLPGYDYDVSYNTGTIMVSSNSASWATTDVQVPNVIGFSDQPITDPNFGGTYYPPIVGYNTHTIRGNVISVAQFMDPIIHSDLVVLPSTTGATSPMQTIVSERVFAAFSVIGRNGNFQDPRDLGGVRVHGGPGSYWVESTWFNASSQSRGVANPPATDQFENPHIAVYVSGSTTHIHTAYHDNLTGSVKYRYNFGGYTTLGSRNNSDSWEDNFWTNLDGGFDAEDTKETSFFAAERGIREDVLGFPRGEYLLPLNSRVVNYATRNATGPIVGKHNAIAVNALGYPVIAYYDETNRKLKIAASHHVAPMQGSRWTVMDVLPDSNPLKYGTGEYVSLKVSFEDRNYAHLHIAAFNTEKRQLVYISAWLNNSNRTLSSGTIASVVDSLGSVGKWCDLSLDENGNPWIAYQDESNKGSVDGVKVAFQDPDISRKFLSNKGLADPYGVSIGDWDTMHVPARWKVKDGRISIECFPVYNFPNVSNSRFWNAAVGYPAFDYFRIAYRVK